jgi:hypothetical protein
MTRSNLLKYDDMRHLSVDCWQMNFPITFNANVYSSLCNDVMMYRFVLRDIKHERDAETT